MQTTADGLATWHYHGDRLLLEFDLGGIGPWILGLKVGSKRVTLLDRLTRRDAERAASVLASAGYVVERGAGF